METVAVKRVFGETGPDHPAVVSIKSMIGHSIGAAGAIEAVALAMRLPEQRGPADDQPDATPTRTATWTTSRTRPATTPRGWPSRPASGSAARTGPWS